MPPEPPACTLKPGEIVMNGPEVPTNVTWGIASPVFETGKTSDGICPSSTVPKSSPSGGTSMSGGARTVRFTELRNSGAARSFEATNSVVL